MAKKKSAEELLLEAELGTGRAPSASKPKTSGAKETPARRPASGEGVEPASGNRKGKGQKAAGDAKASGKGPSDVTLDDLQQTPGAAAGEAKAPPRWKNPKVLIAVAAVIVVAAVAVFFVSRMMFANSTDVWDGTADTSWYSENMTSMTITTAEQLAGMRKLCNDGTTLEGISFKLGRNLDLYDISTKPIGDGCNIQGKQNEFRGNFDGGGHTISGINVEEDTWDHAGLFGSVDGDIRNLTVEGKVTGQVRVGGVVGELSGGSIVNCTNRCKVSSLKTATNYYPVSADVGGVCGIWLGIGPDDVHTAELSNLVNEGEVSARACSAGGVLGTIASTSDVTVAVRNLENDGTVTVYCESDGRDEAAGGVVGVVGSNGSYAFSDLVNNGEVSCSSVLCVGGVIGSLMAPQRVEKQEPKGELTDGVQLSDLKNNARVAANSQDERAHVGGIVGYLDDPDVTFEGCENAGELAATNGNQDDICSTTGVEVWDKWEDEHPTTW